MVGAAWFGSASLQAGASAPVVRLVGSFHGIHGQYSTIQAAVNAAQPGDWILVAPGDYHERADYADPSWPAGVWIAKSGLHLRGMNRNTVIVDGTKQSSARPCSASAPSQDLGPGGQGRNGIEVYGAQGQANNVSIDNLTVCNFLTSTGGDNGNEIWWNGGDGQGHVNLSGYSGTYLTATSTYSSTTASSLGPCCGVDNPSGLYGIFSSDSTVGHWQHDYASNMSDSAYYVGACQQICDMVMENDHGQYSALCLSSTNAGGYFVVQHVECDKNKTGLVNNSQNNDDWPSPQHGACDSADPSQPQHGILGTTSCTVWQHNNLHDNNNPNVPGNGIGGLAGGGPVGTGLILAGSRDITLYQNTFKHNDSWGLLIVDLPDQETGPANCQGGILVSIPMQTPICFYESAGNLSLDNTFQNNGSGYGVPNGSLGDIGLATVAHTSPPFEDARGNCFSGDTDSGRPLGQPYTDPPGIETLPSYQPSNGVCTQQNAGDYGPLAAEAACASQLLAPCPTLETLCLYSSSLPCVPAPTPIDYPRPAAKFALHLPGASLTPTMPNPCAGVPANPWCPVEGGPATVAAAASSSSVTAGGPQAFTAAALIATGAGAAVVALIAPRRRRFA